MKHAIIHLREERLALIAMRAEVLASGHAAELGVLLPQIDSEIGEVEDALEVLATCLEPLPLAAE